MGRWWGDRPENLAEYLTKANIRTIVLKSEWKLGESAVEEIEGPIESVGVEILEFWVPDAFEPGGVDLKHTSR